MYTKWHRKKVRGAGFEVNPLPTATGLNLQGMDEDMNDNTKLLAYCGLYCGDCAGYSGEIADRAKDLKKVIEKYKFELTAKSMFSQKLKDYDDFYGSSNLYLV